MIFLQYVLTDTSVLQISESSGVMQNNGSYEIVLSETADFAESFVLRERQEVSFDKQLYIKTRDPTPHTVKVDVVSFNCAGGIIAALENSRIETENFQSNQMKITDDLFAIIKKYGVELKAFRGAWLALGTQWSVEFFIQSKTPVNDFTDSPAVHFMLLDSSNNTLALTVSTALKTNGHPSETFYIGSLDADSHYYAPLDISLLDGQRHYICIISNQVTKTVEGVATPFNVVALYVDGEIVSAGAFNILITDLQKIVFGGDAFLTNPCVDNFVTFEQIHLTKEDLNAAGTFTSWEHGVQRWLYQEDLNGVIQFTPTIPSTFTGNENSVLLYQDGILTVFANVSDETEP